MSRHALIRRHYGRRFEKKVSVGSLDEIRSVNRLWTADTMTCVFSITKLIASLVIAKLVSDGKLSYSDKVVKYWPEFGKWFKHMVTVEDLINHKAGLIGFCKPIELDQANDLDLYSSIIEESVPYWEPCTGNGYHAVTYGFLLDQLVRRVDEKGRTVAQYHKEEVLSQDLSEFFIGLPGEKFHQVARITNPTRYENILALLSHPLTFMITLFKQLTGQLKLLNISAFSIPYLAVLGCGDMKYNNPRVLRTANMACTGVATARGVAQAAMDFFKYACSIIGRYPVASREKTAIAAPTEDEADVLMKLKLNRGHGFIYSPHPTNQGKWLLLAMGYGEMD
uniref:Beta-lactamase-related domain-containing protein n=1 Tax=Ditylenchus dipsaci TaxID=166011 RepID=A0A915DSZ4_9BILA